MDIVTQVPWSETLTDYDKAHLAIYLRVLDAHAEGATTDEMARYILAIDPRIEPERAREAVASDLRRAQWMTENGYRDLFRSMEDGGSAYPAMDDEGGPMSTAG
jgi:hypothetical protein